jgi:hypothetical protein
MQGRRGRFARARAQSNRDSRRRSGAGLDGYDAQRMLRALAPVLALFLTSACGSVRFERAWDAAAEPAAASAGPERWQGEWRSDWNGHTGGLRCLMERVNEQHLHAWFLSSYARVLSFEHATLFHLTPRADGSFALSGAQDLGKLVGGVYRYEGSLEHATFHATYTAENGDHGVFEMQRVE